MKVRQRHLERLLERGDHDAFVRALDDLCHGEANRVAPNGLDFEDLVQEARIGALKAARAWDPTRGTNPLTFATLTIRRELWKATSDQLRTKRKANLDALRLDQPGAPDVAEPLVALLAAPGLPVDELVELRARVFDAAAQAREVTADSTLVVYHPRVHRERPGTVMEAVQAMHPGFVAVSARRRLLVDGRERIRSSRGEVTEPVWRVDLSAATNNLEAAA